jgi:hypothetical protein
MFAAAVLGFSMSGLTTFSLSGGIRVRASRSLSAKVSPDDRTSVQMNLGSDAEASG